MMLKKCLHIFSLWAMLLTFLTTEGKSLPSCEDKKNACINAIYTCWQPVWAKCDRSKAAADCRGPGELKDLPQICHNFYLQECAGLHYGLSYPCGGSAFEEKVCGNFGDSTTQAYQQCRSDWAADEPSVETLCLNATIVMKAEDRACE